MDATFAPLGFSLPGAPAERPSTRVPTRWCQRIGHGGASALAPANTLESFDAALELGVDMIEFDVRGWRGELVLAHTVLDARLGRGIPLARALEHLSQPRFEHVWLNVDLKQVGCERALVEGLRGARLLPRTVVSSQVPAVLDRLRSLDPRARVGISVGGHVARASQRWLGWRRQVLDGLAGGRWDALMAQHRLVDRPLVEEVQNRGARLYAWTVNRRPAILRLHSIGVDGIVTADPRLFA